MQKIKFLLLPILLFNTPIKSNYFELFASKFVLFYASQFITTTSHELGHALVGSYRGKDPKIVIGTTNVTYKASEPFIKIDDYCNPNKGATCYKYVPDEPNKLNRTIIQSAMGPIIGISCQILQLYFLECFKNRVNSDLYNSLNDFICAKIVLHFIYGLTPFDNKGDGAKLFNNLHVKYQMKTDFFKQAKGYQKPFNIIKGYGLQLMIGYYIAYFLLKLINKNELLDKLEGRFNNQYIHTFCGYLKDRNIVDFNNSLIPDAMKILKQQNEDTNKLDLAWVNQLFLECCIF